MLTRRGFLKGLGAIGIATVLPSFVSPPAVPLDPERSAWTGRRFFASAFASWDDAALLQAAIDAAHTTGGIVQVRQSPYRLSRPVVLRGDTTLQRVQLVALPEFQGDAMVRMEGGGNTLRYSHLILSDPSASGFAIAAGRESLIVGNRIERAAPFLAHSQRGETQRYGIHVAATTA